MHFPECLSAATTEEASSLIHMLRLYRKRVQIWERRSVRLTLCLLEVQGWFVVSGWLHKHPSAAHFVLGWDYCVSEILKDRKLDPLIFSEELRDVTRGASWSRMPGLTELCSLRNVHLMAHCRHLSSTWKGAQRETELWTLSIETENASAHWGLFKV